MNKVIFDSRNKEYKIPVGAIPAHTALTLRLLIAEELQPLSLRVVVQYDRHEQPAFYEMTQASSPEKEGYIPYTATFAIHDTGLYWYHFLLETPEGILRIGKEGAANRSVIGENSGVWQQTVYERAYEKPEWIYGGVYYHIFVDRFHASGREREEVDDKVLRTDWGGIPQWRPEYGRIRNNDFFGGDLEGIRQKLSYLKDLGVTCLYLSPIFEAYSNHKYDTGDYEKIDAMFGTEDDFRSLCMDAGELGIRIICDGVFAHTGSDSKYFNKERHYQSYGAYGNPFSPYRHWYHFHDDGSYDCWWDIDTLPKLNKDNPDYIKYITGENGIVRRWLRAGASGWRLDVADELPVSFLDKLVEAAKAEKPDSLIIGEVWEDASNKIAYDERKNYFEGNRLDGVMNYPFRQGIIDFIRNGKAEELAETVESIVENYPPEVLNATMNILGTHDTPRIITALAGKDLGSDPRRLDMAETHMTEEQWNEGLRLLKNASLLQMTLPGVPCVYYGDEAGVEGYKDPFNRTCYPWGNENKSLLRWYKRIIAVRKDNPVFQQGDYKTIYASQGVFAFARYDEKGRCPAIIIAVNQGRRKHRLNLNCSWCNLLTGAQHRNDPVLWPGDALILEIAE